MADIANIDIRPVMEGRKMNMILAPKPEIVKQVHAAKAEMLAKKNRPERDEDVEVADKVATTDEVATETAADNE